MSDNEKVALAWFSRGPLRGRYVLKEDLKMTREDRAKEAEEYHDAMHIKGWEYTSIIFQDSAGVTLDDLLNKYATQGWELDKFNTSPRGAILVFRRRKEYKR